MKALLLALALVLIGFPAYAQTGPVVSVTLRVYAPSATTPVTTLSVPMTQVTCNQSRVPGTGTTNPDTWRWDDPLNVGRDCVYGDGTRFTALPDGNYEGTAQAVNADGAGPETARVPFTRRRPPNPPGALTGLRITQ
jgi:hypothetical protein